MGDVTKGLYHKFNIERTDGKSAPGKKHDGCDYFVLDLDHDEFAYAALQAYANACKRTYPLLHEDLITKLIKMRRRVPAAASHPLQDKPPSDCDHDGSDLGCVHRDEPDFGSAEEVIAGLDRINEHNRQVAWQDKPPAAPVTACPKCGGRLNTSGGHGEWCPKATCKWGWEVEADGSPLQPPLPAAPEEVQILQGHANAHANALHDYFTAARDGQDFDWIEYHRAALKLSGMRAAQDKPTP